MTQAEGTSRPTIVIRPAGGWASLALRELWEYRELIGFLAWRDILAQYKQAVFGVAWALVKPISQALVYTLIFGKVAKLSSSGLPYTLFTFCGIIAWSFFSMTLTSATNSIVGNKNLITKVYFPRLVVPLAALGRSGINFLISFTILITMMFAYGVFPDKTFLFFPLFLLLGICITLGIGLLFAAIVVKYRDLTQALPFMVQLWFWVTPVAYGIENIPQNLIWIFHLNPMTWIIQGFRWSLLGVGDMSWAKMLLIALLSFTVLFAGLMYFKRTEAEFADII